MHTHKHRHRALRMSTAHFSFLRLLANINFKHTSSKTLPIRKPRSVCFHGRGGLSYFWCTIICWEVNSLDWFLYVQLVYIGFLCWLVIAFIFIDQVLSD